MSDTPNVPAFRMDGQQSPLPLPVATPATASDPDATLTYVQGLRMNITQNLINAGALSGVNKESTGMLTDLLKDMGNQAIQQKRIIAESDNASALGDMSILVNRVLDAVGVNSGRIESPTTVIDVASRTVPDSSEGFVAVPGEMDTTPKQSSYDEFVGRMRGEP